MEAEVTRSKLNRKLGRIVLLAASFGAIWPPIFYFGWFLKGGAQLEGHHLGLMLFLCPPYLASMAFDHMAASERISAVLTISFVNAGLYALFGLFVGVAIEHLARSRDSI